MRTNLPRAVAFFTALLAAAGFSGIARGQTLASLPPRQDTRTPTGVSYFTRAFSHEERDLSIGGGAFPQGLTLDRSYLSSLDDAISQYSGTPSQGWTNNVTSRVSTTMVENAIQQQPVGMEDYLYSVITGGGSVGFQGGTLAPTGGYEGSYLPINVGGESLVFTGQHNTGHFTFTDSDGGVLSFASLSEAGIPTIVSRVAPDGTRLDYHPHPGGLVIISSRGYALIFEGSFITGAGMAHSKACAVNLASTYVTTTSACPAGAQSVTYSYGSSSSGTQLTGFTDAAGQTTSYGYNARGHLDCITLPGQSSCQIANSYATCQRDPTLLYDPPGLFLMDPVQSQTTATGETYVFSTNPSPVCVPPGGWAATSVTASSIATTFVVNNTAGLPTSVTDPLNRVRTMQYWGYGSFLAEETMLTELVEPEGEKLLFDYDMRGNPTERRARARPGSGLADIVSSAAYPATCANPFTCNRPTSTTDANGNTTDYAYSTDHGGVLTTTGPAPSTGAPRPQTRNSYAQRHAWIRNSGGGYSQVASPIWVMTATSICRTSAATGNPAAPCATAADEVLTTYDYGPDSGPNTLLLRGQAVTADGVTLRTCYGYDANGRRISETQPNANLASCP